MSGYRVRINAAEMHALRGLPYAWRCLYMELRFRMDITTGHVGMKAGAGVSWWALREAMFIEAAPGRKGSGTPKEGAVRKWAKGLEDAGLLAFQTVGKRLIFKLLLADIGYSARKKQDSNRTDISADNSADIPANKNNNLPEEQDRQPRIGTPPEQHTPQVYGNTSNTVVLLDNAQDALPCPHRDIISLWTEILPMCPSPKADQWRGARAKHLRTRWAEDPQKQNLLWWKKFFQYIAKSEFLTGRKPGSNGDPFLVSLGWLVKPENFYRVVEGEIR